MKGMKQIIALIGFALSLLPSLAVAQNCIVEVRFEIVQDSIEKIKPVLALEESGKDELPQYMTIIEDKGRWKIKGEAKIKEKAKEMKIYCFGQDKDGRCAPLIQERPITGEELKEGLKEINVTREESGTKEYLCILFSKDSKEKLEFKEILKGINEKEGSLFQKLRNVLGEKLVEADNVRYVMNNFEFSAWLDGNASVVPVVIEIRHQ